jgi:beta-D-xylosidase 4
LLIGNPGIPCKTTTPLSGLKNYIKTITYTPGCHYVNCTSTEGFGEAASIAAKADAVVMVVGLDQSQEAEKHDRQNLTLPGEQRKLVTEVASVSKGPMVLVIMSGGPVDVSFAIKDPRISSILWVGYPGEAGGQALAEVIFGDYNPGNCALNRLCYP